MSYASIGRKLGNDPSKDEVLNVYCAIKEVDSDTPDIFLLSFPFSFPLPPFPSSSLTFSPSSLPSPPSSPSNQIASIPKKDTKLRDLEELIISKNKIKEVPDEFLASLPSLKTLDASRNELSK